MLFLLREDVHYVTLKSIIFSSSLDISRSVKLISYRFVKSVETIHASQSHVFSHSMLFPRKPLVAEKDRIALNLLYSLRNEGGNGRGGVDASMRDIGWLAVRTYENFSE